MDIWAYFGPNIYTLSPNTIPIKNILAQIDPIPRCVVRVVLCHKDFSASKPGTGFFLHFISLRNALLRFYAFMGGYKLF